MFAINGILYGGYFVIGILYLCLIFAEKSKWTRAMGILAIFWASSFIWGPSNIRIHRRTSDFYSPVKPSNFLLRPWLWAGIADHFGRIHIPFAKREFDRKIIFPLSQMLLVLIIILSVIVGWISWPIFMSLIENPPLAAHRTFFFGLLGITSGLRLFTASAHINPSSIEKNNQGWWLHHSLSWSVYLERDSLWSFQGRPSSPFLSRKKSKGFGERQVSFPLLRLNRWCQSEYCHHGTLFILGLKHLNYYRLMKVESKHLCWRREAKIVFCRV